MGAARRRDRTRDRVRAGTRPCPRPWGQPEFPLGNRLGDAAAAQWRLGRSPRLRQLLPAAGSARPRSGPLRLQRRALRADREERHRPGERELARDLPQRQPLRDRRRSAEGRRPEGGAGMEDGRRLGDLHLARPPDALDDRGPATDPGQGQEPENQDLRLRNPDGSGRQTDHPARDALVGRQCRDPKAALRDRRDRDHPRRRRAGVMAAAATGRGRRRVDSEEETAEAW